MDEQLGLLTSAAPELLGRPLSGEEARKFSKYLELLVNWSSVHRLVGSSDPEWIVENLLLDSLLFLRVLPPEFNTALDIGSGAGLPGVPIAIVKSTRLTMIESRRRRASFLSAVVRELPLARAAVIGGRAEALVSDMGSAFDVVVMRCAGALDDMFPLAAEFVRPGGVVAASGPPAPYRLRMGNWVTVPRSAKSGRWFAVYKRPPG